jgi:hypothetical protein
MVRAEVDLDLRTLDLAAVINRAIAELHGDCPDDDLGPVAAD